MKPFRMALLAFPFFLLAGCSTTSQQQTVAVASRVQQVLEVACPVMKGGIAGLQPFMANNLPLQDAIQQVEPTVLSLCSQMTTVDTSSIQQLVSTGLPALVVVVNSTELQPSVKSGVVIGLTTAQALLQQLLPPNPTTPMTKPQAKPGQSG